MMRSNLLVLLLFTLLSCGSDSTITENYTYESTILKDNYKSAIVTSAGLIETDKFSVEKVVVEQFAAGIMAQRSDLLIDDITLLPDNQIEFYNYPEDVNEVVPYTKDGDMISFNVSGMPITLKKTSTSLEFCSVHRYTKSTFDSITTLDYNIVLCSEGEAIDPYLEALADLSTIGDTIAVFFIVFDYPLTD